jgi:predicted GIY-YIG superfamily endonuclease
MHKKLIYVYIQNITIFMPIKKKICNKGGGVYRYENKKTGNTIYIGRTVDFVRRSNEHTLNKNSTFTNKGNKIIRTYVSNPEKNKKKISQLEKKMIAKYNPSANKNKGG